MNEELINKIITYNYNNFGNEFGDALVDLQKENARLKDKLNKINDLLNKPIFEYDNIPNGIEEEINELKNILKEN